MSSFQAAVVNPTPCGRTTATATASIVIMERKDSPTGVTPTDATLDASMAKPTSLMKIWKIITAGDYVRNWDVLVGHLTEDVVAIRNKLDPTTWPLELDLVASTSNSCFPIRKVEKTSAAVIKCWTICRSCCFCEDNLPVWIEYIWSCLLRRKMLACVKMN